MKAAHIVLLSTLLAVFSATARAEYIPSASDDSRPETATPTRTASDVVSNSDEEKKDDQKKPE